MASKSQNIIPKAQSYKEGESGESLWFYIAFLLAKRTNQIWILKQQELMPFSRLSPQSKRRTHRELGLRVSKHSTYSGLTAKALTGPKWVESMNWSERKSTEKQMQKGKIMSLQCRGGTLWQY